MVLLSYSVWCVHGADSYRALSVGKQTVQGLFSPGTQNLLAWVSPVILGFFQSTTTQMERKGWTETKRIYLNILHFSESKNRILGQILQPSSNWFKSTQKKNPLLPEHIIRLLNQGTT